MILSPLGSFRTTSLVRGNCSMINGETFGLKPPVPMPSIMTPSTNVPREPCVLAMTGGSAEIMKSKCAMIATARATQIVL